MYPILIAKEMFCKQIQRSAIGQKWQLLIFSLLQHIDFNYTV